MLSFATLCAAAAITASAGEQTIESTADGSILLRVEEGGDVRYQVADGEVQSIAEQFRSGRQADEGQCAALQTLVASLQGGNSNSADVQVLAAKVDSLEQQVIALTAKADAGPRVDMAIFTDTADPSPYVDNRVIADGAVVTGIARGLIAIESTDVLAYTCGFGWGAAVGNQSYTHSAFTHASTTTTTAQGLARFECPVPKIPSAQLETPTFDVRFIQLQTASGEQVAFKGDKPSREYKAYGPLIAMSAEDSFTTAALGGFGDPRTIPVTLTDLDTDIAQLTPVMAILQPSPAVLDVTNVTLTASSSGTAGAWTITIPPDSIVGFGTANISITVTDNTGLSSSRVLVFHVRENTACKTEEWADKDHGLICGECKVLVNRFGSYYKTCNSYCAKQEGGGKLKCKNAYDEQSDTCGEVTVAGGNPQAACAWSTGSSDAICECEYCAGGSC